jgi:hypothetical protein
VRSSVFKSSGILFGELEEGISASKRYGNSKLYPFDFMKKNCIFVRDIAG